MLSSARYGVGFFLNFNWANFDFLQNQYIVKFASHHLAVQIASVVKLTDRLFARAFLVSSEVLRLAAQSVLLARTVRRIKLVVIRNVGTLVLVPAASVQNVKS